MIPQKIQDFNPYVFLLSVFTAAAFHKFSQSGLLNWRGIFACASEFGSFTIMFVMHALVNNNNYRHETPEVSFELSQECILIWGTLASLAINTNWKTKQLKNLVKDMVF